MLSIGVLGASSERYYIRSAFDAIDEYYVRGEERGYWMGNGAASLGLSGEVAEADLHAVLEGRSPFDGESMLATTASKGRSRPAQIARRVALRTAITDHHLAPAAPATDQAL